MSNEETTAAPDTVPDAVPETVYIEHPGDGVAVIVLNQPRKKNAISAVMMDRLRELLVAADDDPDVRVVVLRGAGEHFSSGGDLSQTPPEEATPARAREQLRRYLRVIETLRQIATPVVAMVDGYAVGGAFSLILACDLVCVSDRAAIVPAFCQIGIVPEMGMMKLLPDLVGQQRAKEILFLGERLSGADLKDLGIANRVLPAAELEPGTMALARRLAEMPALSIQITKGIVNAAADTGLAAVLQAESTASPFCTVTGPFAAGR
ncbi:MAG TPA: enoyl-CoA hydratase/isomerase family protein [Cellulomonas sp.]